MSIDTKEFFTAIHAERDGRDVLVSPIVFWDVAQQLNAKVELLAYKRSATEREKEIGREQGRVVEDAPCTECMAVWERPDGPRYLIVSDPDVPVDSRHYAKVSP